jgi:hypothetical protein
MINMKKISLFFCLIFVITLAFLFNVSNDNNIALSTIANVEALASENGGNITMYCCSPYTSICVAGGSQPNVMGKRKSTPCSN